ncbi:MAG: GGDEF domain-containing protein [Holdemania massiliensis]
MKSSCIRCDHKFRNCFPARTLKILAKLHRSAGGSDSRGTYPLQVKGSSRWFKVVARPLWVMEESSELTGVIGKFIDVHDEQVELDQLKQMAKIDSLTGLFNRAYAKRAMDTILNNEADASQNYALLVFDIDFFKSANDEYGHLFGDQVLANVAHRIQSNVLVGYFSPDRRR